MLEKYETYGQAHQARALRSNPNLTEGVDFAVEGGVAYLIRKSTSQVVEDTMSEE